MLSYIFFAGKKQQQQNPVNTQVTVQSHSAYIYNFDETWVIRYVFAVNN